MLANKPEANGLAHIRAFLKCPPSPSPSGPDNQYLSSNMSHRSSLSMDSGCLSLTSDATSSNLHHNHQYATSAADSGSIMSSLPPSRKNSTNTSVDVPILRPNPNQPPNGSIYHSMVSLRPAPILESPRSMYNRQQTGFGATKCSTLNLSSMGGDFSTLRSNRASSVYSIRLNNMRPKSIYTTYPEENTIDVSSDELIRKNISPDFLSQQNRDNVMYRASKIIVNNSSANNGTSDIYPRSIITVESPRKSIDTMVNNESSPLKNQSMYRKSGFAGSVINNGK